MADQLPNSLKVRLVTPDRVLVDQTADAVEVPGKNGYFEVLYGHAPLMAELGAGDVIVHGGPEGPESVTRYNVSWGFLRVAREAVDDVPRAEQQLAHGQQLWKDAGESEDAYTEALHVIAEAEAKLASAAEKH